MIIKDNQSIFDLVTQFNGDVRSCIQWCLLNGYSVTDNLSAGDNFQEVETEFDKSLIQEYYISKEFELATADVEVEGRPCGVGYWFVENDFCVQEDEVELFSFLGINSDQNGLIAIYEQFRQVPTIVGFLDINNIIFDSSVNGNQVGFKRSSASDIIEMESGLIGLLSNEFIFGANRLVVDFSS